MRITIDSEVCAQNDISLEAVLYLLSLTLNKPITQKTIKEAWNKGAILVHETAPNGDILSVTIEKQGKELVDTVLTESTFATTPTSEEREDRYLKLADALREIYPKGRKEGTAYMWRDSRAVIAKRLKSLAEGLAKENGISFTDEQAINATRKYVESFNGDYKFMQLLKYFIWKSSDENIRDKNSQLLSYIENEGQDDTTTNRDWTTELV